MLEVEIMGRRVSAPRAGASFSVGQRVLLVVRPESVELGAKAPDALCGTVRESVYLGSQMMYEVEVDHTLVSVEVANPQEHAQFKRDEEVSLRFHTNSLHVLPFEECP
jgi:ABC-type Fe3+/spermidine/putrescine transport system ATPase subunit